MLLTGKLYDALKFIALVALPAVGALYFAISQIWGLPNENEVVGTIVAVDTFLGGMLHLNSQSYNKSDKRFGGVIDVTEMDDKKNFMLTVNGDPNKLDKKKEVLFKVNSSKK